MRNDACNYVYDMLRLGYEKSRKTTKTVQKWLRSYLVVAPFSLRKKIVLLLEMQGRVAKKQYGWVLEGKEDYLLSSTKQECIRGVKWTMEGWKKDRQRRIHSNLDSNSSISRLSRLCTGASFGNGEATKKILNDHRGSASHKLYQKRQQIGKFTVIS